MSCDTTFPDIDPEETRTLTFEFANGLPAGVTLASATLEVTSDGLDPTPSARFSSPQIVDSDVLVVADGCLDGNTYHLRVIAPTSDADLALVMAADLTCRSF